MQAEAKTCCNVEKHFSDIKLKTHFCFQKTLCFVFSVRSSDPLQTTDSQLFRRLVDNSTSWKSARKIGFWGLFHKTLYTRKIGWLGIAQVYLLRSLDFIFHEVLDFFCYLRFDLPYESLPSRKCISTIGLKESKWYSMLVKYLSQ